MARRVDTLNPDTNPQEVSWHFARLTASQSAIVLARERIPLIDALDRNLATDCMALCDLSPYTTSAMDGWAVAGPGPWRISGDVKAGAPLERKLDDGTAVRIATGAVIPDGTFAIARWEIAMEVDGYIHASVNPGSDIRPAGEESRKGDLLVRMGMQLTPSLLGLLASTGYDEIEVFARPRVALLLLGDELQHNGIPANGMVRDSLGPQLPGWLGRLGAQIVSSSYVTDELQSVVGAIEQALEGTDLIVTTGGTADGPRDHVHSALNLLHARYLVDRVKSRPGHPMLLASIPHRGSTIPFIGLPGNPQSAIVGLMTLIAPLISASLGSELKELETVRTRSELSAPKEFTRLVLGNLVNGQFEMGEYLGSAMLRGLAFSTGFAVAPAGLTPAGGEVRWLPLP